MSDDFNLTDKNGKPLRGAAKIARLKKLTEGSILSPLTIEDLTIIALSQQSQLEQAESELKRLERQQIRLQIKQVGSSISQAICRGIFGGSVLSIALLVVRPDYVLSSPKYLSSAFFLGAALAITFPSNRHSQP